MKEERDNPRAPAASWDPEPGDILKGYFTGAKVVKTKYGKKILAFVKDLEGEEFEVWCTRTKLLSEMSEAMPAKDSMIALEFHGKVKPQKEGGNEYFDYTVRCRESNPQAWHKLLDQLDQVPAHQQVVQSHVPPELDPF
jgi:hypothetical protein